MTWKTIGGIIIAIFFLVIVLAIFFSPETGLLNRVAESSNRFANSYLDRIGESQQSFQHEIPEEVASFFDRFTESFEKARSDKKDCLIFMEWIPKLGYDIEVIQDKQDTVITLSHKNRVLKMKKIEGIKPCAYNLDGDYGIYSDKMKIVTDISKRPNNILLSNGEKRGIEPPLMEHYIREGEEFKKRLVYFFYKPNKDELCFLTGSAYNFMPGGKYEKELCCQDAYDFITKCEDIRNKERCESKKNNLNCIWEKGGIFNQEYVCKSLGG